MYNKDIEIEETVPIDVPQYAIHYYGNSYQGERNEQQDSFAVVTQGDDTLAVIADGMGGLAGGKAASQLAVSEFTNAFAKGDIKNIPNFLYSMVVSADKKIAGLRDVSGRPLNSGSTAVGVYVQADRMYYVSVGDSRIYIFRDNQLLKLTKDHNYAMVLEKEKDKMSEDVYNREMKRKESLVSYLGMNGLEYISYNPAKPVVLYPGDYILMCSDGLYKKLNDTQIEAVLKDVNYVGIEHTVQALQYEAMSMKTAKKQDNTTIVLLGYI